MLIPAIDLQGGRVVQLVRGEKLALAFDDPEPWIDRFSSFPLVQVIDLDAARGTGANTSLVERICRRLPCRVGGGLRTIGAARALLEAGAREVIFGSVLYRDGEIDTGFAADASHQLGLNRIVAAVDTRGGHVVIHGWNASTSYTAVDAARLLEPYAGGFLYTIVEGEGMMQGIDLEAVRRVRGATSRRLTAAGGIRTHEEIDLLDAMGVDAVVGMAVYTGKLRIKS
jgi:phosphoribosylformimino-5-aminoimidazole carboxamide ribotide isomerase